MSVPVETSEPSVTSTGRSFGESFLLTAAISFAPFIVLPLWPQVALPLAASLYCLVVGAALTPWFFLDPTGFRVFLGSVAVLLLLQSLATAWVCARDFRLGLELQLGASAAHAALGGLVLGFG